MLSIGTLVWISCKPLLKLAIATLCGAILSRYDLFGGVAARGAGQVMLNVTMPALLFSKIVPSFTSDNLGAIGPLLLVGILYKLLGFLVAWVVSQFFWVPHRFRYGILVAGGWGNWGDLPTSVVMGITSAAPFAGSKDGDLGVAYIAILILVFFVTLFPLGGHLLIAKDFEGPDFSDDEVRESFSQKAQHTTSRLGRYLRRVAIACRLRSSTPKRVDGGQSEFLDIEKPSDSKIEDIQSLNLNVLSKDLVPDDGAAETHDHHEIRQRIGPTVSKHVSFHHPAKLSDENFGPVTGGLPAPSYADTTAANTIVDDLIPPKPSSTPPLVLGAAPKEASGKQRVLAFLRSLLSPPTITIFVSFPIALVPQLKSLFVLSPSSPRAPDNLPPLSVILETAKFLGDASVPLALICLGSALAHLNIPRPWTRLPLGAISAFTVGKMFLMPVLGVLICQLFTYQIPLIDREDRVLRFVCIIFSSLPTATTQVFLTQLHSPDGNAEHLSAFLLPQYAIMFLSMTTLTAYTLHLLFV